MFEVVYHHLVRAEDIPRLSSTWKEKIRRAIEDKLTTRPEVYGKPLRRSLKGYRKLRVSDYRVVYRIEQAKVKVLVIQHRSIVYELAAQRIHNNDY